MTKYLVPAIKKLRPSAEFSFTNDDYSTIKWDILEGEAPTQTEIDKAIKDLQSQELEQAIEKAKTKAALLERLGITAQEAALLLS